MGSPRVGLGVAIAPHEKETFFGVIDPNQPEAVKFDGYRASAIRGGPETKLLSRNQKDLGKKFHEIVEAIAALDLQDLIIDGRNCCARRIKAVRPLRRCKPSIRDTERPPIVFYAFDLLRLNGKELRDLAIEERKAKLAELFTESPAALRYSIGYTKAIKELLEKVRTLGLEGLIGKRSGSRYEAGKRSGAWIRSSSTSSRSSSSAVH